MKKIFIASSLLLVLFLYASEPRFVLAQGYYGRGKGRILAQGKASGKNTSAKLISARLTAINGTTLTVVGADGKTYTINTDGKTDFRRHYWGKSSISEMTVNDRLNISGKFADSGKSTVQATWVRDMSIMKRYGVFYGKVTALLSANSFTLNAVKRGPQTVTIDQNTKFTNKKNQTIAFTDVKVGDQLIVKGEWDMTAKTIVQVSTIRDSSR